ncbi:4-(cytidine 5'-diphospho)-2-C-methyl-D-erythritol kinase [Haematospirillum sp. 15-248]|uniref:4-(cytidine 5'-diphospho)-2-C-methyl-D-erythritol kinase n=1 Tax=Haematospirillum sp. 15-248 TaxID=2723107 RepID=UPI00143A9D9C|nr:4-(cytidine 5'-diphospho)-2-C-methyl-D-erythritol kinase [Haematospirillum sp. 15-248]NKD87931.1 4-(cytidine 5'-diphospho)-2-C-methyl-D-erythritol kinase [Haematospirillum sp. 15-248]
MTTSEKTVCVAAPAKVNLTLHLTARRDDGYHMLESLVVFAGILDHITLEPAETFSLVIEGPQAHNLDTLDPADNITLRAARSLAALAGRKDGVRVVLEKNIPVSAGIGGGSADAAAVLHGLIRLWSFYPTKAALHELALGLGADVPVCLQGRSTIMEGIGDILHEAPPLPGFWLVLANPGVEVSTPRVFRAHAGDFLPPVRLTDTPRSAEDLAIQLRKGRNDLTAAAISLEPVIGECLALLTALPSCLLARMSGSGATCWALFSTEYEARTAAKALRTTKPAWWVAAAPVLHTVDPFGLADSPVSLTGI